MVSLTLLGSVARNALVGAVATKIVDTLIVSKINTKLEKNKWERSQKIELFSKLSEDIVMMNKQNLSNTIIELKKTSAKIALIIHNKNLTTKIDNYIKALQKIESNEESLNKLEVFNNNMINYLRNDIRRS